VNRRRAVSQNWLPATSPVTICHRPGALSAAISGECAAR
jgi:hypothetical protein